MRAGQHDRTQRGLQELAQANTDLLNAYALLQEERNDPGPHPVAGVDPLLSGAYGFITGVHVKAPVGSVLSWMNQSVVQLEGRSTTDGHRRRPAARLSRATVCGRPRPWLGSRGPNRWRLGR